MEQSLADGSILLRDRGGHVTCRLPVAALSDRLSRPQPLLNTTCNVRSPGPGNGWPRNGRPWRRWLRRLRRACNAVDKHHRAVARLEARLSILEGE